MNFAIFSDWYPQPRISPNQSKKSANRNSQYFQTGPVRPGGGGKGGIYPPNNMNYNPLLTWLQIYLKIYNGVFTAIIVTVHSLQYIIEAFALYREKNVAWQIVLL